jgi:hypothetical protein
LILAEDTQRRDENKEKRMEVWNPQQANQQQANRKEVI